MKRILAYLILSILIFTSCGLNNSNLTNNEDTTSNNQDGQSSTDSINDGEEKDTTLEEKYNYSRIVKKPVKLEITEFPAPSKHLIERGKLANLPELDNSQGAFKVDFRGYDLSELEIGADRLDDLRESSFNTATKWPENLPEEFNPMEIMELGKNPGLGVRELHKQGINGNGIGIAIIDQKLLVSHKEYSEQLKFYEEIHSVGDQAQLHGPAVASIAVGKTVGVAPEADLYYIAETHGDYKDGEFHWDFTWLAMSIDRILEVNKTLPEDKKIRVISISVGWSSNQKGYKEVMDAVKRAKEQNIFVVSTSLDVTHNLSFNGLGRDWYADPDDFNSYTPGYWWEDRFYSDTQFFESRQMLLVPMDERTTASPIGDEDYVFYGRGGWSWSIPYISGLYVLACQVNPDITPEEFWKTGLATGDTVEIVKDEKTCELGKIVNPVKLIEELKKNN